MTFVAPARYVLSELHRPDPDAPPVTTGPDPSSGVTVCGLPMLSAECWLPVERGDGDALCPGCELLEVAEAQAEATLF